MTPEMRLLLVDTIQARNPKATNIASIVHVDYLADLLRDAGLKVVEDKPEPVPDASLVVRVSAVGSAEVPPEFRVLPGFLPDAEVRTIALLADCWPMLRWTVKADVVRGVQS